MAPFALLSGRRHAQFPELASPPVGTFVSTTFSGPILHRRRYERESSRVISSPSAIFARGSDSQADLVPKLPSATAGLVAALCFLVFGILIFGAWKFFQGRGRRKGSRKEGLLPSRSPPTEKGFRPFILAPSIPLSPSVRWVPAQISPWLGPAFPRKPTPSLSKDSIFGREGDFASFPEKSSPTMSRFSDQTACTHPIVPRDSIPRRPPPVYCADQEAVENSLKGTLVESHVVTQTPPVSSRTPLETILEASQPSESATPSRSEAPYEASPTSSSSHYSDSESSASECSPAFDGSPGPGHEQPLSQPGFPKVVIVKRSFPVSLPDELKIKAGERLKLLQEFKDGWSLCQRTSKQDREKGVVPRCCLVELRIDTKDVKKVKRKEEANGQG